VFHPIFFVLQLHCVYWLSRSLSYVCRMWFCTPVFLCCVTRCMRRLRNGSISCLRSPTKFLERFLNHESTETPWSLVPYEEEKSMASSESCTVDHVVCLCVLGSCLFLWLYSPLDLGRFFSFLILYTVDRTPWTGYEAVSRPLLTYRTTQTQNKCTHRQHASSAIRTHDPSVRESEDGSCLRPLCHCDRRF
jgi:hypothetical protein